MSDKNTCSKHPVHIPGWEGSLKELAYAIENMRYDKVVEFLKYLGNSFGDRAGKDFNAGKFKLAKELFDVARKIAIAEDRASKAWEICKPYMEYPLTTGCCNVVLDSIDECCKCEAGDW